MAQVGRTGDHHNKVALQHRDALQTFNQLFHSTNHKYAAFSPTIREQFARFRVWAENVGAHQTGRVSLDYRLREAADVKEMVIELLGDLQEALQEALAIVSGEKRQQPSIGPSGPPECSPNEHDSTAEPETEELDECLEEVVHVITCLYRLSITIQNPAPLHRLEKSSSIDVSHFEYFDIQHVSNKFPGAEPYLVQRLGRSNTRRRQLLRYHERHHEKIASQYDAPFVSVPSDQGTGEGNEKVDDPAMTKVKEDECSENRQEPCQKGAATNPLSATTVTAYQHPKEEDTIEQCSDTDFSQTSYSSSAYGTLETLRVPPPPNQDSAFDGEPFQCPYCFIIITVTSQKYWKKHFFRDLRPYVCTFKECPKSDHLFDTRNDWFEHEVEMHRREYFCNACHETSPSRTEFQGHLQGKHSNLFNPDQLQTIIDRCERPIESAQCCPLCPDKYVTGRLRQHLGGHLQQISLFVPRPREDGAVGEGSSFGAEADESEHGSRSGSGSESESKLELESNPPHTSDGEWYDGQIGGGELAPTPNPLKINGQYQSLSETTRSSQKRMEKKLERFMAEVRGGFYTVELMDEDSLWQGLRRDLEDVGILPQLLSEKKEFIVSWSKTAIAEGTLEEVASNDDDLQLQVTTTTLSPQQTRLSPTIPSKRHSNPRLLSARQFLNKILQDNKKFLEAAEAGNIAIIMEQLGYGIDKEVKNENGWTALHLAAKNGHETIVKALLDSKAEKEAASEYGWRALHRAAYHGHEKVVKVLLDSGVEKEAKIDSGHTALHFAAQNGHEKVVKVLLESGVEKEAREQLEWTALHFAAQNGHEKVVKVLLDSGAEKEAEMNENGWRALHLAAWSGHETIVKVLLDSGAEKEAKNKDGFTALHIAAQNGHETVVKVLLDSGAEKEAKNRDGFKALHLAAANGHETVVKVLLDRGVEKEAKAKNGFTALHLAAQNGHEKVVKVLLDSGVDKEARNEDDWTALHLAAQNGHEKVVKVLLDSGVDKEAKEKDDWTALHLAAKNGHEKVVKVLLDSGAEKEAKIGSGHTALLIAAWNGHETVVKVLLDIGVDKEAKEEEEDWTALYHAAHNGHEKVVKVLLDSGVEKEAKTNTDFTALHIAAQNGHEKVVKFLLDSAAEMEGKEKDGGTALHLAAENGHETVVKLLLDRGANKEARNNDGRTARDRAVSMGKATIEELLE